MKRILIHIIFTLLIAQCIVLAQRIPIGIPGEYRDIRILPNNDTLVYMRQQTPYWLGLNGGANFNMYFSDLNVPLEKYGYILSESKNVDFPASLGTGWFFGLAGEYMDPFEDWGIGLRIQLMDVRETVAETDPLKDSVKTSFVAANVFNYLSISPFFRYNFPSWTFPGLHLYAGADVEIKTGLDTKIRKKFVYTSQIDHDRNLDFEGKNVRWGLHFGMGLDMFAGDFWNRFRGRISPYVDFHFGSNVLNDYNSSRNTIYARAGVSLRFSRDAMIVDTLKFDTTYVPPYMATASVLYERGIAFSYEPSNFIGQELALFEDVIVEDIAAVEPGIVGKATATPENTPEPPPPPPQISINPNTTQRFSYATSSAVELTDEMRNYLDAVANYMRTNPNFIVRLFGHSDNLGTALQQEERSQIRVNNAMQYLMSKGIPQRRIIARADGARVPIGDFRTEAGRRQNRRLEIVIMQ